MSEKQAKSQWVNMMKSKNCSTKSIGRLILIISVIASTPFPNISHYKCNTLKALHLRVSRFLVLWVSKVNEMERATVLVIKTSVTSIALSHHKISSVTTLLISLLEPKDVYLLGHHSFSGCG